MLLWRTQTRRCNNIDVAFCDFVFASRVLIGGPSCAMLCANVVLRVDGQYQGCGLFIGICLIVSFLREINPLRYLLMLISDVNGSLTM